MSDNIRTYYAPKAMEAMNAYHRDLNLRVRAGAITEEEAIVLAAVQFEKLHAALAPTAVKRMLECPDCHRTQPLIGEPAEFFCPCSPDKRRSVPENAR